MKSAPQLTIVITTFKAGLALKTSLNSILQQQTVPSFEVLIVSQWPNSDLEAELQAWDPRFKMLVSGIKNINAARNLGLKNAAGEYILFLDDESWTDDRLFLKKHIDAHQKHPRAIGVGGVYKSRIDANPYELAYFVTKSWQVAQGRINETQTALVPPGNMSFKLLALRSAFSFDEQFGLGASTRVLLDQLAAAGQELHFTERLAIEHRPRINLFSLLSRAVHQGRNHAAYEAAKTQLGWKFFGAKMTRTRLMQEQGISETRKLKRALWLYDFGFAAGEQAFKEQKTAAAVSFSGVIKALFSETVVRIKMFPHTPAMSGVFLALRWQVARRKL